MPTRSAKHAWLTTLTIESAGRQLRDGSLSVCDLVSACLRRIADVDVSLGVNSVIELNSDAMVIAEALDAELREDGPRGPLHGIPVLIKDNIDTGDKMQTSAGSLALVGQPALADAPVVARLRAAGAVVLGKTNLSEWANMRSSQATSGWSSRGGQTRNPHRLTHSPGGSSAGSAAAVAAGLCLAALGTETDGSVIVPSSMCGVVGVKPTIARLSNHGVVPILHVQDTVGVHARTVADASYVLNAIVDRKVRASAHVLSGARLGVVRPPPSRRFTPEMTRLLDATVKQLVNWGAILCDPVHMPLAPLVLIYPPVPAVLVHDFPVALERYLRQRAGVPVQSLADVVAYNQLHADVTMALFHQDLLTLASALPVDETLYRAARVAELRWARSEGIDRTLREGRLDALVSLSASPAEPINYATGDALDTFACTTAAAVAGYPHVTVPTGLIDGLPVGLSFIGRAWSEARLLSYAAQYEARAGARHAPALA
ncbi:MAG: amidase family protein [Limisphaerales bacterium]